MKALLALLPLLLTACAIQAAPRDNAQWTSTVQGVSITWRAVTPGTLGTQGGYPIAARATNLPGGSSCVVDIDMNRARFTMARIAAHEAGHCLQARYLLAGIPRPDISPYHAGGSEGFAETYALRYLSACGDSLRPLGWQDQIAPLCAEAPDPRSISVFVKETP